MIKAWCTKASEQIHAPYAVPLLGFLFFLEAIFFIPVDPLLVIFCIHHKSRALYYALIATCCSVAGGLVAYFIGRAFWETIGQGIVYYACTPEKVDYCIQQYKLHQSWALLLAGFTPMPFKLVTYCAGICKAPISTFIIFSFIARGFRFFLVAFLATLCGEHIKNYIDRYFFVFVALLSIVTSCIAVWYLL